MRILSIYIVVGIDKFFNICKISSSDIFENIIIFDGLALYYLNYRKTKKADVDITSMAVETMTAKLWQEKVTDSVLPVVVNFSAVRCGFCQALEPLYNRLSEQYKDKLVFLKLMVDDKNNQELIDRLSIEGTPTLKFYCKNREIGEHIGYTIEPKLKQKIDMFLEEMEYCINNSTAFTKNIS